MAAFNLKRLAEQLDAAQRILHEIRITSGCEMLGPEQAARENRIETAIVAARRAVSECQRRTRFLGSSEMFGEPAWDILLDLFIRQTESDQITATSASAAAGASPRTAARWLAVLEQNELILTEPDPEDSRRQLVRFTPAGYEGMLRYLETSSV